MRRTQHGRRMAWPLLSMVGRQLQIGRRDVMPINVVLLHIVIVAGIMALAAGFADGGK